MTFVCHMVADTHEPRTANRDQVRGYLIAAIGAWMVAMGEVRG